MDSLDPDVAKPRLTSFNNGVFPRIARINLGPAAPILASTNAPPIQSKNGPNKRTKPSMKKLDKTPSSVIPKSPNPPRLSTQLSNIASKPMKNMVQCSQRFGSLTATTRFTPSSISI